MFEQVTALRHQAAIRRDDLKAEVEDMPTLLAAKKRIWRGTSETWSHCSNRWLNSWRTQQAQAPG